MDDFLKAIWTDDFNIKQDVKEVQSVFLWKTEKKVAKKQDKSLIKQQNIIKNKLDKEQKELKLQWYKDHDNPWYSFIYKWKDWFHYKFFCKRLRFINSFMKKNADIIEISHYRPVESCSQAQVIANRKRKKYKTAWWYILSDEFFSLLCTYTK